MGQGTDWESCKPHPPGQEPMNELLLLRVAGPISLDVPVELIFKSETVVLRVQLSNLEINGPKRLANS